MLNIYKSVCAVSCICSKKRTQFSRVLTECWSKRRKRSKMSSFFFSFFLFSFPFFFFFFFFFTPILNIPVPFEREGPCLSLSREHFSRSSKTKRMFFLFFFFFLFFSFSFFQLNKKRSRMTSRYVMQLNKFIRLSYFTQRPRRLNQIVQIKRLISREGINTIFSLRFLITRKKKEVKSRRT